MEVGVLATLALTPVWYRLPALPLLPDLYVMRFLILLPVLWTLAAWLLSGFCGLRALLRDPVRRLWALCWLLLALWAFVSQSWAFMRLLHPEVAATAAVQLCLVVFFALAAAAAGPSPRAVVAVLALTLLWNAVLTIAQALNQGPVGLIVFGEFRMTATSPGASVVVAGAVRWLRPYGLLPHPNVLAGFLAVALLALPGWILAEEKRRPWWGAALLLLGLCALLLTFSRAAWLGFAVGALTLYPLLRRHLPPPLHRAGGWKLAPAWRPIFAAAFLTLLVVGGGVLLYRPLLAARAGQGSENVEMRSLADRSVYTAFALQAAGDNLLFGVGCGNFPWRASYDLRDTEFDLRGDNVHQVLLSAWAELGLVGFTLLVGALIFGLEAALRSLRSVADTRERAGLLAGVLALIVIGLFDHYPYSMFQMQLLWWGLLALALRPAPLPQAENAAAKGVPV
ncbi:MAG: O-antigen ligase family protein [Chloroflexi bacterium]|nr:O-antigen ligase family protein [Chloroflexota bacterium]